MGGNLESLYGLLLFTFSPCPILPDRVRDNLHVVLAMSPIGESFRNRTRMYPGLVNCTTIDWFQPWPADALVEVATKFIQDIPVRRGGWKIFRCRYFALLVAAVAVKSSPKAMGAYRASLEGDRVAQSAK